MALTKAQYLAKARERADAAGSGRWDDADLAVLFGGVHWREWANILNANNRKRVATRTVTPSAGLVPKSALSISGESFYRIISVRQSNIFLTPGHYEDNPLPPGEGLQSWTWYEMGDYIQINTGSDVETKIVVNHRPTRVELLNDSDNVEYPEGYEIALVYLLAGEMLLKGGAETEAGAMLMSFGGQLRADMMDDIRRISVHPTEIRAGDDKYDWGSQ